MPRVPSLSRLAVDVATNALRCCAEPARKTKLTRTTSNSAAQSVWIVTPLGSVRRRGAWSDMSDEW